MAQPVAYVPAHTFLTDSASIPLFPGQALDVEFNDLKTTTDQIRTNLALIQRDDGRIANGVVTYDSLDPALTAGGIYPLSTWGTATAYIINQCIVTNGNLYKCLVSHTSGTFATDLAAAKWTLLAALPIGPTGATGAGSGSFTAFGISWGIAANAAAAQTLLGIIPATLGGTGIANNAASTLTISGAFGATLTIAAAVNLTIPSGTHTAACRDTAQTFTADQIISNTGATQFFIDNPSGQYSVFYFTNASTPKAQVYWDNTGKNFVFNPIIALSTIDFLPSNVNAMRLQTSGGVSIGSGNFATDPGAGAVLAAASIKSNGTTSGIGYATGAGGAVTQGTNRTTGVILNTVSGDITLISAAGSATPASFTVTNSAVAATDTISINQKSGTDLYEIFVTNVAAGSFKITSFTTGGTTTEQPVFHFNIIKGVNA